MKRIILLIALLGLAGCTSDVTPTQVAAAIEKCNSHGGYIRFVAPQNNFFISDITCNDGTVIRGFKLEEYKR